MTEQLQTTEKNSVTYTSGKDEITLTPNVVTQFVTKGNGQISTAEAYNFIQLCRYNGLNPFLNEAYIIKFGNAPAQLIVSKEAFMKRAERQETYQGFEAGVISFNPETNDIAEREGAFSLPNEQIVGGWAKVYRSDRERPVTVKLNFSEFAKYKNGSLQSTWANMPANMIRKSAIVNALREAYPDQLGAMYTEDEPNLDEPKVKKDVTAQKKSQDLLTDFKKEVIEVDEPENEAEPTPEEPKEAAEPITQDEEETSKNDELEAVFAEVKNEEVSLFEPEVKSKLD